MGNPTFFRSAARLWAAFWAVGVVTIAPAILAGPDRASAGPINVPAPPRVNVPTVNVPKVTAPTVMSRRSQCLGQPEGHRAHGYVPEGHPAHGQRPEGHRAKG